MAGAFPPADLCINTRTLLPLPFPFPQVSELELTGQNKDRIEIALGPTNITNAKNFLRTDPDIPDGKGMFIIRQTFM